MLERLDPLGKIIRDKDEIIPMAGCICNGQLQNYSFTRDIGPGCWCSCVGTVNRDANGQLGLQK